MVVLQATSLAGYPSILNSWLVENFCIVQIYYSSLEYYDYQMTASYTFMALLSDIGEVLGLLFGTTLLTVYEIGEFLGKIAVEVFAAKVFSTAGKSKTLKVASAPKS